MIIRRVSISVFLMGILLLGQTVWAATFYVDRSIGSDSNTGLTVTAGANGPFRTVSRCAVVANDPGDTCLVKNGTYPETISATHSGTATNPIVFKNYPGHAPVLNFADQYGRFEIGNQNGLPGTSYITVEGFNIGPSCYNGIKAISVEFLVIRKNKIHNCTTSAILGGGYHWRIEQNQIYDNGTTNFDHGVYLNGQSHEIINNLWWGNKGFNLQLSGYPFDSSRMPSALHAGWKNGLVANNTIAYSHIGAGITLWSAGNPNNPSDFTGNVFENNLFYENHQDSGEGANGVKFTSINAAHVTFRNNLCYATAPGGTNCIDGTNGVQYDGSNNIVNVSNPNMVNAPSTEPESPNFSLKSSSPAIDAGVESLATVDFAGIPRPQGPSFDIGAYEGAAQSDVTSPTPPAGLRVF